MWSEGDFGAGLDLGDWADSEGAAGAGVEPSDRHLAARSTEVEFGRTGQPTGFFAGLGWVSGCWGVGGVGLVWRALSALSRASMASMALSAS